MALFLKIFLKWYELFVCQSETVIFCSKNLETISLNIERMRSKLSNLCT